MPEWLEELAAVGVGALFATKGVLEFVSLVRRFRGRKARRLAMLSPAACGAGCVAVLGVTIASLSASHPASNSPLSSVIALIGLAAGLADLLSKRPPQADGLKPEARTLQFANPKYKVAVALDGSLTHLVVRDASYVLSRPEVVRGACFFQRAPLRLTGLERPAENTIIASSEAASVRYEFDSDSMTWTLTNRAAQPMGFVVVFNRAVHTVMDEAGTLRKLPVERHCAVSTWFAGTTSLRITGSTRIWGPWSDNRQVWTADLAPGETREVLLEVNAASDEDVARAMDWWRVLGRRSAGPATGHPSSL